MAYKVQSVTASASYHEVPADIWLEDFVKGALGEGAAVEGENLRHVAQAVFIMSGALYCQGHLGVVRAGSLLRRAGRVEYIIQSHCYTVAYGEARVSHCSCMTLRLRHIQNTEDGRDKRDMLPQQKPVCTIYTE